MRAFLVLGLMMLPGAAWADGCVAPVGVAAGAELAPQPSRLGWTPGEARGLGVEALLAREAFARCQQLALVPASGYQKQTEFDNTPYRFNMKPGQKLSADEFEAWMASRGIRIVRAKPEPAGAEVAPVVGE